MAILCLGGLMGLTGALVPASTADASPVVEARGKAPRVRVVEDVIDLGVVHVGERAEASFALANDGDGDLVIEEVKTGCRCTLVDFDRSIAPGQVGHVLATLETDELDGPVTKGVQVKTNDPRESQITLTLKALVVGSVELLPQPVIFMRIRAGEPPVGRALIRRRADADGTLTVEGVTTSSETFVARAHRLDRPRPRGGGLPDGRVGDWVLEVRFRDDRPVFGPLRDTVHFRTGLARQPVATVTVKSELDPPVHLSTQALELASDGARGGRGILFASMRRGLDPSRLRVEAVPEGLEVRLEKSGDRMFKIDVRWAGGPLVDGSLSFHVDDLTLSIPVEWHGR